MEIITSRYLLTVTPQNIIKYPAVKCLLVNNDNRFLESEKTAIGIFIRLPGSGDGNYQNPHYPAPRVFAN